VQAAADATDGFVQRLVEEACGLWIVACRHSIKGGSAERQAGSAVGGGGKYGCLHARPYFRSDELMDSYNGAAICCRRVMGGSNVEDFHGAR
jgi:hypothetical protein